MVADREPCPFRIVDDMGGAFVIGAVGGSIFHGVKGARNSPANARFSGALYAIKARAPVLGGGFAVWGAIYSSFDCSFAAIRRKEDPWNSIFSGAATGAVLAARSGPKIAATHALWGGVFLGLIEGFGIFITRMTSGNAPEEDDMTPGSAESQLAPPI